jgi:hypothetical protein
MMIKLRVTGSDTGFGVTYQFNLKNSYLSEHELKILHECGEHAAIPGAGSN